MLTSRALSVLKDCLKTNIAYAQYKIGSTYYRAEISGAEVLGDGRLAIQFEADNPGSSNVTITQVQLYDHSGQKWMDKAESVILKPVQEGVLYRCLFTIEES